MSANASIVIYAVSPFPHYDELAAVLQGSGVKVALWHDRASDAQYPWDPDGRTQLIVAPEPEELRKLFVDLKAARLVVICGWAGLRFALLLSTCALFGKPYAIWLDVPEERPEQRPVRYLFKRWWLGRARFVLGMGTPGLDRLEAHYEIPRERLRDVPYLYCIPAPLTAELEAARAGRDQALRAGAPIRLLLSNRFIARKGYDVVERALRILSAQGLLQRFCIEVLGSGPLRGWFQGAVADLGADLRVHGWVPHERYLAAVEAADVLLHPSRHEPYGIPPLDAMAHGRLVIASSGVMSARNLIRNGENGLLFDPEQPEELAEHLAQLAQEPSRIAELGAQGRRALLSRYGPSYYQKVFAEMLGA